MGGTTAEPALKEHVATPDRSTVSGMDRRAAVSKALKNRTAGVDYKPKKQQQQRSAQQQQRSFTLIVMAASVSLAGGGSGAEALALGAGAGKAFPGTAYWI